MFFEGGGTELVDDTKLWLEIPFKCDIDRVTMIPDQSGSIAFDVWVDSYANAPPTVADTIVAAAPPTISATTKGQDTTLSGWTKGITAGDIFLANIDSCTTITQCSLSFKVSRS